METRSNARTNSNEPIIINTSSPPNSIDSSDAVTLMQNLINSMDTGRGRVPFFYPESQDVNDWIVAFEVITQRKDGQRVDYLPTVLKNKALSWYASEYQNTLMVIKEHGRNGENGLKSEFGRSSMAILNELVNRCQKDGESPQDYYQSMITLCSLANSNMTEVEKVSHLLRGLNPTIREKIVLMCPNFSQRFFGQTKST